MQGLVAIILGIRIGLMMGVYEPPVVITIPVPIILEEPTLIEGKVTTYCDYGTTASGTQTRTGICASSYERLGKTVVIYKRLPNGKVGDILGYFDCEDTGGTAGIKDGTIIDVWKPDLEACKEFMELAYEDGCNGNIYIQVFDAVG